MSLCSYVSAILKIYFQEWKGLTLERLIPDETESNFSLGRTAKQVFLDVVCGQMSLFFYMLVISDLRNVHLKVEDTYTRVLDS